MKYNMWTHAGINEYKHVLTFACVQMCVGPACPCIGACMFLNINALNSVYMVWIPQGEQSQTDLHAVRLSVP